MIVLSNTDRDAPNERKYVDELRAMRAGIILTGGGIDRELHLAHLSSHPAPVVMIGRHALSYASVHIDNVQGAFEVTMHLIDLGRDRIAFIGGPLASATAADRLAGFRRAMAGQGGEVDEAMVVESDFTIEGGVRGMRQLLAMPNPPCAVFAASDHVAIGAMREAKLHGLSVPKDIAIAGFNDEPRAIHVDPQLTTLHLPMREIGEIAANLLLSQIKSRQSEPTSVPVRGELIVRGSTIPQTGVMS